MDYPALIWVEYKSNPNDTYLYSTERIEVRNEYHKQEIFKKLHESVKVRIDLAKSNLTLTELTKYYTNIQIATNN
ncbi:MAG: hypothetical protein Q8S84_05195 [bacterium]|nr:hypothetical protein [bacterium]